MELRDYNTPMKKPGGGAGPNYFSVQSTKLFEKLGLVVKKLGGWSKKKFGSGVLGGFFGLYFKNLKILVKNFNPAVFGLFGYLPGPATQPAGEGPAFFQPTLFCSRPDGTSGISFRNSLPFLPSFHHRSRVRCKEGVRGRVVVTPPERGGRSRTPTCPHIEPWS